MSLASDYFERMYDDSADPWGFGSRWYERRKRNLALACLPAERYGRVFEPGCATGILTEELAGRCDALLATDVISQPLDATRRRLEGRPHVRVARMTAPHDWPTGQVFDLVVLSELGYYFDEDALALLGERTAGSLAPGGTVLACHWRHPVREYPSDGDAVHHALHGLLGMAPVVHHEEEDFLLDVWCRPPALSVARRTGLLE